MRHPQDAMKVCKSMLISDVRPEINIPQAAWALQGFATTFYVVFSVIIYAYIGNTVASPALLSLPPIWSKITFGIGLVNFLL